MADKETMEPFVLDLKALMRHLITADDIIVRWPDGSTGRAFLANGTLPDAPQVEGGFVRDVCVSFTLVSIGVPERSPDPTDAEEFLSARRIAAFLQNGCLL